MNNEEVNRNLLQEREEALDSIQAKLNEMELSSRDEQSQNDQALAVFISKLEQKLKVREAELGRTMDEKSRYQKEHRRESNNIEERGRKSANETKITSIYDQASEKEEHGS